MLKQSQKNKLTLSIFELLFLIWSGVTMLSVILVILGIFYPIIIVIYLITSVGFIWTAKKNARFKMEKMLPVEKYLLIALIIFSIFLSSFTVPTIFGGRDEGALSNSAFLINKDHGLNHQSNLIDAFGKIYGEGKALNFPGFFYQKNKTGNFDLRSQFLPGYSSYLANFAYTSNPSLLKFANTLPLIIFLLAFYLVIKQFTKSNKLSILGVVLLSSLAPLGLFYKFTLSEIFFASLLWPSLYFLIKYLQLKSANQPLAKNACKFYYWLIFIPLLPSIFVRIEAMGIIFILVLILILQSHKQLQKPTYQTPILLTALFSVLSIFLFSNFFVIAVKGLLGSFISTESSRITSETLSFIPKNWQNFYLLKLFYTYNLIPLFFFSILAIVKLFKEKAWLLMMPLFFLGITGLYLIDANISIDHPWMLRRFVFSIFPLTVLYTILFFWKYPLRQTFMTNLIFSVLILSNGLLALPFITFQQNNGLLKQTEELSSQFKQNDLVLVSQKSSGSGWSIIAEPLRTIHNKQAIYFFNPGDYAKINKSNYNKIYLLTSEEELNLYKNKLSLEKVKDYTIKNQLIKPTKNPLIFPEFTITEIKGAIYEVK